MIQRACDGMSKAAAAHPHNIGVAAHARSEAVVLHRIRVAVRARVPGMKNVSLTACVPKIPQASNHEKAAAGRTVRAVQHQLPSGAPVEIR